MTGWDLVIFDNDGVLVDSERLATQVEIDLLAEYGYRISFDECVRRFLGGTIAATRAAVERDLGRSLPADFEDRYHDALFAEFQAHLQPVAGVREVLDELQQDGVSYCVASSGTHERIRQALSIVGLLDRFPEDRIFSADDVAHGKPAPDLFLLVARERGVAPDRCVVVEDSPAGVEAARAAGMTVVGYAAMTPAERLAAADTVINSMSQLLPVLSQSELARPSTGS